MSRPVSREAHRAVSLSAAGWGSPYCISVTDTGVYLHTQGTALSSSVPAAGAAPLGTVDSAPTLSTQPSACRRARRVSTSPARTAIPARAAISARAAIPVRVFRREVTQCAPPYSNSARADHSADRRVGARFLRRAVFPGHVPGDWHRTLMPPVATPAPP